MAIAKNGPQGPHTGKVGNIVYYMLNGKNVSRAIGITTKPPTEAQLNSRLRTKISSKFFGLIQDFIKVGFGIEALGTDKNAFNLAIHYNKKNMFIGEYPDFGIAYDQLLLSKGKLKPAEGWEVAQVPEGLHFTWMADPQMPWTESTDQVMMLAYFPEEKKAVYILFGSNRVTGQAFLEIPSSLKEKYMETYMAFVSADRKQLSDSTYTGNFNQS